MPVGIFPVGLLSAKILQENNRSFLVTQYCFVLYAYCFVPYA